MPAPFDDGRLIDLQLWCNARRCTSRRLAARLMRMRSTACLPGAEGGGALDDENSALEQTGLTLLELQEKQHT